MSCSQTRPDGLNRHKTGDTHHGISDRQAATGTGIRFTAQAGPFAADRHHARPACSCGYRRNPLPRESPRKLVTRLSRGKAAEAFKRIHAEAENRDALILAADTVVYVAGRILPKAETLEEAEQCLRLLSGRAHRVYTGLCLITPQETVRTKLVETRIRFKRLSKQEFEAYLAAGEWRGKAGGYAIQGIAESFVIKLIGSYSNVVGLPLYETSLLLGAEGYEASTGWSNA